MPKKIHGLDWLDYSNPTQLKWALGYLSKRGINCNVPLQFAPSKLKDIGQQIENDADGKKFLSTMRNSWSQENSRSTDNRKTYSFRLLPTIKRELDLLANKSKKNSTELLTQLITDNFNDFADLKKYLKAAKDRLKLGQADAKKEIEQYKQVSELAIQLLETKIADCCKMEILLRDTGIAIDSATDEQTLEAEEMAKANIAIANAAIDKKHRSLSGLHSIKSPMGRPNSESTYTPKKKTGAAKISETTMPSEDAGTLQAKLEAKYSRYEEMLNEARAKCLIISSRVLFASPSSRFQAFP